MSSEIHETAIINEDAEIGDGCVVGPYSVIGAGVVIGAGNRISSHVVIEGRTTIGNDNQIFQFASIGAVPQDLKYKGEESRLEIGDGNIVREYVTMQPGTAGGGMLTKIGDHNLFMAQSHVAHDVILGNQNILANSVALAGHIVVEDRVIVAGLSGVHQYVRLGSFSYVAAGSMVSQDVPPFCMVQGDRAGLVGINSVGLKRGDFSEEQVKSLKSVFKSLFYGKQSQSNFKGRLEELLTGEQREEVVLFLNFIRNSPRGVCALRSGDS